MASTYGHHNKHTISDLLQPKSSYKGWVTKLLKQGAFQWKQTDIDTCNHASSGVQTTS